MVDTEETAGGGRHTGWSFLYLFLSSVAVEVVAVVHKVLSESESAEVPDDPLQLISPQWTSVSSFVK